MELNVFELLIKMGFEPSRKGFALIAKSVVVILKNNCKPMKVNEIYNDWNNGNPILSINRKEEQ